MDQRIRFCAAPDGVRVAYAIDGDGPGRPLVRTATWLTHLERDAASYRHWHRDLGADRPLVRYDLRGSGLSDRDVTDLSIAAQVADLEAVVDAAGLSRFDLLGLSGGGPVALTYAVRHPERVAHLLLYGTYARGRRVGRSPDAEQEADVLTTLTLVGWGKSSPAYRRVFTTLLMPDATPEQVNVYDELQRVSASARTAARIREAGYQVDVSELATEVRVPTLVLHVRQDAATPFAEGRRLATLIPGAELVALPGRNHILGAGDPAWAEFVRHVRQFVDSEPAGPGLDVLTGRERAVLALVAEGLENDAVARRMSLSVRTVEHHLSSIYTKLGLSGRSARAAATARFVRGR